MAMVRYVTVNEVTGKVVNVGQVGSERTLESPGINQRHILETDWVVGSDPALNDEWDGQTPTTFLRPAETVEEMSADEILNEMALHEATGAALRERLRVLLG